MNIEDQKKCIVTIPEDVLADLRVFVVLHGGSIKDAALEKQRIEN